MDVYHDHLGNVIMKLIETYEGLEIYWDLAQRMTRQNPDERPTASECMKLFYVLVSRTSEDSTVYM
ncbi:hypothetical protein B0H13DRAFT_379599 [Mycena leptocephala]|nr:hypothetical protein B0H13DRAFT_379599 [Mycena leptocephala]